MDERGLFLDGGSCHRDYVYDLLCGVESYCFVNFLVDDEGDYAVRGVWTLCVSVLYWVNFVYFILSGDIGADAGGVEGGLSAWVWG